MLDKNGKYIFDAQYHLELVDLLIPLIGEKDSALTHGDPFFVRDDLNLLVMTGNLDADL